MSEVLARLPPMDKIICIGKNYLKHAKELGDAVPTEPIYFIKPPSACVQIETKEQRIAWPEQGELHHEVELVLKLSRKNSTWIFSHYTFGLDMTMRDIQSRLKKAGLPWEKGKVFKNAAIVGPWRPVSSMDEVLNLEFSISIDGKVRQKDFGREMRWQPSALLEDLQRWLPLCDGDLLFTGTPDGVGPIKDKDQIEVRGGDIQYRLTVDRS